MLSAAGHSLGGALATLAAFDIRRHLQLTNIHVVTFGAPRTGNRAFAREYEQLVPDTWHVINARVSHHVFVVWTFLQGATGPQDDGWAPQVQD